MAVVTPDLSELFEEAYARAGLEMRSGYDLKTVRRSLNLLTLEWQNRGLNLWTIEPGTIALVAGTETYALPADTIDLIEMSLRTGTGTNQIDQTVERISVSTYSQQTTKNVTGRPVQGFIRRLATQTTVTLWPVPDTVDSYTLAFFRLRGIESINSGISGTADVPPRFVPCLVAGLAYYVAMKRPEVSNRVQALKQEYEFQFELAAGEDRDSASVRFVPFNNFYGGS
jgi:hypothetical protein